MTQRPDKLTLLVMGHNLANLIVKHGGWLDENDNEIVRFPTPHAMAMFERELEAKAKKDKNG